MDEKQPTSADESNEGEAPVDDLEVSKEEGEKVDGGWGRGWRRGSES